MTNIPIETLIEAIEEKKLDEVVRIVESLDYLLLSQKTEESPFKSYTT